MVLPVNQMHSIPEEFVWRFLCFYSNTSLTQRMNLTLWAENELVHMLRAAPKIWGSCLNISGSCQHRNTTLHTDICFCWRFVQGKSKHTWRQGRAKRLQMLCKSSSVTSLFQLSKCNSPHQHKIGAQLFLSLSSEVSVGFCNACLCGGERDSTLGLCKLGVKGKKNLREPGSFLKSWGIFGKLDCSFPSALSEGNALTEGDSFTFGFLHSSILILAIVTQPHSTLSSISLIFPILPTF